MISDAEAKTRAALVWVRPTESGRLIHYTGHLDYRPDGVAMKGGRRIKLPSLHALTEDREIVVTLIEGGRILRVIDSRHAEGWSTTAEIHMPAEFRLEAA